MKMNCASCGIFVAEIVSGSNIRKNAVMVCDKCFKRYQIADELANMARKQANSSDMPDFLLNLFDKKS